VTGTDPTASADARPDPTTVLAEVAGVAARAPLPPDVRSAALAHLQDGLAAAVAGAGSDLAGRLSDLCTPGGPATVVGRAHGFSAADAAWINGTLMHLDQWDDASLRPVGHPTCTVLPAVLALAEEVGADGERIVSAFALGLEAHARLGLALPNWTADARWLPIGTAGLFAAALAAAHVLGLDEGRTRESLRLAAAFAGLSGRATGTVAKPLGAGTAARTAVVSARLAAAGERGPADAMTGDGGVPRVLMDVSPAAVVNSLASFADPWHLVSMGVALKMHPVSWATLVPVELTLDLAAAHGLTPPDVVGITVRHPRRYAFAHQPDPQTPEAARFSFQYCLAAVAVLGAPRPAHFRDLHRLGPRVGPMLTRVRAEVDPDPDRHRFAVTIRTRDGEVSADGTRPVGHPRRPAARSDLLAKTERCLEESFADGEADQLAAAVTGLASQGSTADLAGLLRPDHTSRRSAR
jgi:2-methylcitrate dehydratase PrpD